MNDSTDISVIILNYKTKNLTLDCVKSVVKYTKGISYEVILVDNNSEDGSAEAFREFARKEKLVKFIASKTNTGFTGGNNLGLAQSEGEFILFLNSDTILSENSIKKSVDFLKDNPQIGVLSCQLQNLDGSLQSCGGYFPTLPRVFAWMFFIDDLPVFKSLIKAYHPAPSFFDQSHYQDWLTGAFFLTRKKILEKVGGWDKKYFMYVEDVDLCYRMKNAGWKIYFWTGAAIKHIGSASSISERSILSELKNLKLFYKKHMPSWQSPVLWFLLKVGSLLRLVLLGRRVYAKAITNT